MQWRNEIEAHTDGLKIAVWHGSARESDITQLMKYDVVLTTYAVVERCVIITSCPQRAHNLHIVQLLPQAAKRLQTQGQDHQGEVTPAPNSLASHYS